MPVANSQGDRPATSSEEPGMTAELPATVFDFSPTIVRMGGKRCGLPVSERLQICSAQNKGA